jgi:hypothetical protein
MSRSVGLVAGSLGLQEGPAATVPRSSGASSRPERCVGVRRCHWPHCDRVFVPRTTGGKPQKWCSPRCRELAKAAARAVCPHCGASLRPLAPSRSGQ